MTSTPTRFRQAFLILLVAAICVGFVKDVGEERGGVAAEPVPPPVPPLVEALTPLLISVNARHKSRAGIKLTGLPDELW